jgi:hypothetical protein
MTGCHKNGSVVFFSLDQWDEETGDDHAKATPWRASTAGKQNTWPYWSPMKAEFRLDGVHSAAERAGGPPTASAFSAVLSMCSATK